jgi:hypothetical protein
MQTLTKFVCVGFAEMQVGYCLPRYASSSPLWRKKASPPDRFLTYRVLIFGIDDIPSKQVCSPRIHRDSQILSSSIGANRKNGVR